MTTQGLLDAAMVLLVEARSRDEVAQTRVGKVGALDDAGRRRLGVAITATHTVLEPPSLPTDELRKMGLWWD
jgi:hypothetical protein